MRRVRICAAALVLVAVAAPLRVAIHAYSSFGKWSVTPVVMYINPANADLAPQAAEAALQAGMDIWNAQSGSSFRFVYGGRVSDTTTGNDGKSVIIFRNQANGGTLASTYSWSSNGSLVDSDIIFWDGGFTFFTGTSGCSGGAYVEDVAAHELGHALGLSHSDRSDATMYPTYGWCSQAWRSLSADDIAGVTTLYPVTSPPPPPVTSTTPVVSTSPTSSAPVAGAALQVRGYKIKGAAKADLTWSGLSSASIDVYRNKVKVTSTPNDGAYTDPINRKGGGSYTYRVCASGTSTCSNEASVAF